MDAALLGKLFGREQVWNGPCVVVVMGDASVQALAPDTVTGGGAKVYATRLVSGRIAVDGACLLKDGRGVILMQQYKIRQPTGEDVIKQIMTVVDAARVVAVEFPDNTGLAIFGLPVPVIKTSGSHPGTQRMAYE